MNKTRRMFLKSSGIALPFVVAGKVLLLSPAEAFAARLPLQVLSSRDAAALGALADAIVPGAREAGITHFVDKQLAAKPADSLLMLKYLGVPPPFADFYQSGFSNTAQLAKSRFNKNFSELESKQLGELIHAMAQDDTPNWSGAPASFFFFVLRADAADVVYGTEQGFERIDMPYMAHIAPVAKW